MSIQAQPKPKIKKVKRSHVRNNLKLVGAYIKCDKRGVDALSNYITDKEM